MRIGYFLSSEDCSARQLVDQARMAEQAGFDSLWISDHYHPWLEEQGQSPFVWSVLGAIAQVTSLPVTTAVTCPIARLHPAVIAQAAATTATLMPGRFTLGVGSGEALNEHILGERWPSAQVRLGMLEEALEIIRALWAGDFVYHHGTHFTVENAKLYSRPERPPSIYVSGLGPAAAQLAGRVGDGYISTAPDAELLDVFRQSGGQGKPTQAGLKVAWSANREQAIDTGHELWRTSGLPGELSQILPSPVHFEQASQLVTRDMVASSGAAFGDDPGEHLGAFAPYVDAGFDEIYVSQMGAGRPATSAEGFFAFYEAQILPQLRS